MATVDINKQVYPSDDKTLPFTERIQLAIKERNQIQTDYQSVKNKEANDIMDTVEMFVQSLIANDALAKQFMRSIHHSRIDSKRKVVEVYTFNAWQELGNIYNQTITSPNVEGKYYSTKYILSGGYRKLTDKYIPERSKTVKELLQEVVNGEKFNNGVDSETKNSLHVCVFWKKGPKSTFKNGIYVSRDGIEYT
tara:strand:- start:3547 stop:4128 length:582 start_codon:yes stop_codon:yes gene_type:complete